ncbi:hypothetical protein [Paenibacillus hexagrammi]|uniref:Uncharacterized protein n=1 Tax=Paenibacillus hexagrammi TaxID=2908839 RepID=A0ABY3SCX7_9BACL|nr:hypothetical protein [Paenibacillus sp. YPD9-1]UJF31852.1 hypothetical protein L0M14_19075 [Paenibacillus sp. YPD9-1]
MERVNSSEELMDYITNMDRSNSVCQFFIPGKGTFTIVLQEEDNRSILADAEANPELKQMIEKSKHEFMQGQGFSTSELLKSLSKEDFK